MSILNIGTSALLTTQGALATTSHNISNVNTEGYNRQRIEQGTRTPDFNGGYYTGSGVQIDSVQRLFDQFLADQVRLFTSQQQQLETFTSFSKQLDNLLGSESLSLSTGMDSFFDATQAVADDPTSIAARQVMLTEAETLANRFNTLDTQLTAANNQINLNLDAAVKDINTLAQGIANINRAITEADGAPGVPPNDLLDQRDQLINDLSKLVSVSTIEQSNGVFNVFIGSGQPLVTGNTLNRLSTIEDPNDANRLQIAFGANQVIISNQLTGGKVGGLFSVRKDVIDTARVEIDSLAAGLASAINQQHRTGISLNGNAGGNLFTELDPLTTGYPKGAAGAISVAITDPRDLAVAFPVNLSTAAVNDGTGKIEITAVDGSATGFNAANALPGGTVQLEFDAVLNEYSVVYGTETINFAYNPASDSGKTFDLNSLGFTNELPLTVKLTGSPEQDDAFTINNAGIGASFTTVGDNRNALALAELQVKKTLDPSNTGTPTQTFGEAYGSLVANVATRTNQASAGQAAQQGLLDQTRQRYDAISGVNLDEEAANLIKFQQSYQAAAQIITVSNTIFDTLINSF
ncbi:MAG TPA: flagellar hook-associated protein FlgK [Methylophaga sp.]|nr:flagellar hook-associated protein FlgK [Methylophaga sp.]